MQSKFYNVSKEKYAKALITKNHKLCEITKYAKVLIEQKCALKNVNNFFNTNNYSYLETSGGQSPNLYFNVVHFFKTSVN